MVPSSAFFDQSTLACLIEYDAVVQDYRAFFALFDWHPVLDFQRSPSLRGRPAHPEIAYFKAFLVLIHEGFLYMTQLRRFLLKHPLLIIELGFHLVLDPSAPFGFVVEQTVPCSYWLRQKLRALDTGVLQALLQATVAALQAEIPGLGETVAFDVKHIYAWVKENNPRVYVKDRYNPAQQLAGDPDCTLGVKKSTNQEQPDGSTKVRKKYVWGYGSGVAAATIPDYGDVVVRHVGAKQIPFRERRGWSEYPWVTWST